MKISKRLLSQVADVVAGQSPPSSFYNKNGEGLPFYQGKSDFGDKYPIARNWCAGERHKVAIKNDILLSVRAPVGPVNICDNRSVIGRGISAIRAKTCNSFEYLYFYLKDHEQKIAKLGTGSTFKAITQSQIGKIKIPLPDNLEDQLRIAAVLTRAENLIAKRKESIKALDELLKSTFLEMFGDPVRNEHGWEVKAIIDGCKNKNDIKCGPFGTQLSKSEFQKNGVPLWGIPQINSHFKISPVVFLTSSKAIELSNYSIEESDIVMSRKGTVGKCALYPADLPKGVMHSDLLRIRIAKDIMNPSFLCFQLRISKKIEKQIDRLSKGAIMAGINVGKLKSLQILCPPLPLQNKFATIVEKVESLKVKYTQSLAELENLYGSLSQRAFKGELDLSGVQLKERTN